MKYILEYIWLGGNYEMRSKIKVHETSEFLIDVKDIPAWNYDGSSTSQTSGENSEINLLPVSIYKNPFFKGIESLLVLCETRDKNNEPLATNNRYGAKKVFDEHKNHEPWFGLEQEFFILSDIGTKKHNNKQGQYYCSVGAKNAFLRHIIDRHMIACIDAGLKISGTNAEVAPYQWEFQIGPCGGIESGDQLWVARYLLEKIAEEEGYYIDWSPKPFDNINGSGCHANFSTKKMRESGGLAHILTAIKKLEENHDEHMKVYGDDNHKRMSGQYETSSYGKFSFDVNKPVNRGASIRVGHDTIREGKGYFEDRRPASNIDPYLVTSIIMSTCAPIAPHAPHAQHAPLHLSETNFKK
jgi:glutamine synthetase